MVATTPNTLDSEESQATLALRTLPSSHESLSSRHEPYIVHSPVKAFQPASRHSPRPSERISKLLPLDPRATE